MCGQKADNQTVTSGTKPTTVPETGFDTKLAQFIERAENASKVVDENTEGTPKATNKQRRAPVDSLNNQISAYAINRVTE